MRAVGLALAFSLVPRIALAQATLLTGLGGPLGFGTNSPPRGDDDPSPLALDLGAPFPSGIDLYGRHVSDVFVNVNGALTLGAPIATFDPAPFPRAAGSRPMIAGWWANVDTRAIPATEMDGNQIYYASTREHFVATWVDVGSFDQHIDRMNAFQIILAPSASVTGAVDIEWRYHRCEWTAGDDAATAQAGFDVGDGIHFATLPGSGTAAILSLCSDAGTFHQTIGGPVRCGNGFVEGSEACDDGNDDPHDACDGCMVVTPCSTLDASADDAGIDAAIEPCPEPDAGIDAAVVPDVSHHDGGHRDDGGVRFDAGPRFDSGVRRDGSVAPPTHALDLTGGGCGCRAGGTRSPGGVGWAIAMIAALRSARTLSSAIRRSAWSRRDS